MNHSCIKGRRETGFARWEGLVAVLSISMVSLILFYIGLPLWAVVIVQIIGFFVLHIVLKVAFTRTNKTH